MWKARGNVEEDADVYFTCKDNDVYAIVLSQVDSDLIIKSFGKSDTDGRAVLDVAVLGSDELVSWRQNDAGLHLSQPQRVPNECGLVFRITCERLS